MVKIRYAELPAGLHVDARLSRGETIVYLSPGLTTEQRRAALNRVRSSGRMGHGPRPSDASLFMADRVDRVKTVFGNGAAAFRGHPILLLPSLLIMAGTLFAVVSLATIAVHPPGGTRPAPQGLVTSNVTGGAHLVPSGTGNGGKAAGGAPGRTGAAVRRRPPMWDRYGLVTQSPWTVNQARGPATPCVLYGLIGGCGTE